MEWTIKGIIIKSSVYKESDAILTCLSREYGLVSFKARGVLKVTSKNAGSCQLYTIGEYHLTGKNEYGNKILTNVDVIKYPSALFDNGDYLSLFAFLSEAILKLELEDNQLIKIYDVFAYLLNNINKGYSLLGASLIIFKYLFDFSGLHLQVDECSRCGNKKNIVGIAFNDGGFICVRCASNTLGFKEYPAQYLKLFRYIQKAEIENVFALPVEGRDGYLILVSFFNYLEESIGIYFKSKEILLQNCK